MTEYRNIMVLAGDKRTREVKRWTEWLRRVPAIRRKFCRWADDFDPFHWNEAASVAVLANAAAQAGYLSHTEYVALKRNPTRGRPFRRGRCDLWVADVKNELSWAFEVKQHFAAARTRESTLDARLEKALKDAQAVDRAEADRRVGCLIVVPRQDTTQNSDHIERFDRLCERADVAFRIGGGLGPIWFAFALVP